MSYITNNIKAFKAEWIKLKGTGVWWMIGGTCLFMAGSGLLIKIFADGNSFLKPPAGDPWASQIEGDLNGFMFFYILLSILMVVRLCQIEHRNQGWKLIETQPIHRMHLYLAKFKMAAMLSLASLLCYLILSILAAYGYSLYKNLTNFQDHSIPWMQTISYVLRIWISSWGLIAFIFMLSIWISNFAVPFLIGFVCTVVALTLQFSGTANWFPFAAPVFSSGNFNGGIVSSWLLHYEKLSIVWMLLFLWIGYQYYLHRNWKQTLISGKQALKFAGVAALVAVLFYFIEKPVVNDRYTKTVIAGVVASDAKLKGDIVFLNATLMDTLMVIPLREGSFHAVYTGAPLQPGKYTLAMGRNSLSVFMGHNDSVYINWNIGRPGPPDIRGTRIAENSMWRTYIYQDRTNTMKNKPSVFVSSLVEQWQGDMDDIESFKTVDNIKPSKDFTDITKKLTTISYLQAIDIDYPAMHAMYYPGDTLKYPPGLEPIRDLLGLDDTSLLMYTEYADLLDKELRKEGKFKEFDYDSSYLQAVVSVNKDPRVKNVMLFNAMNKMIANGGDSAKRNELFNRFIVQQKESGLSNILYKRLALQNSLMRGLPAPAFEAVSIAGNKMGLKDFKGRYVVVDVWATWCGPCKGETPFFERYAEMYAGDKVAFVSLSVDEGNNVYSWQFEAAAKSKRVVQLRAEAPFEFMSKYAIESIPRFMLIDPEGKLTMINMPRPSDPVFEDYLLREVGITL
jgi:thiol-disulfide isomerase/thioredoxin